MSTTIITAESRLSKLRDDMLDEAEQLASKADQLEDDAFHIETENPVKCAALNSEANALSAKAEAFREAVAMVEEALSRAERDMTP